MGKRNRKEIQNQYLKQGGYMKDKEMIKQLLKIINVKMEESLELLKRLPFEDLSVKEQERVILSECNVF